MSPQLASLIRKELQRQRPQIWFGIGLTFLPYVLGVYAAAHDAGGLVKTMWVGGVGGCLLSLVLAAFVAGFALAGERPTRSLEFLEALPIDRKADWLSRLLVAGGILGSILAFHGLMVLSIVWNSHGGAGISATAVATFALAAAIVLSFGVSWCVAARVSSPAIAGATGLGVNLILALLPVQLIGRGYDTSFLFKHYWELTFPITALVLGLGGLWLGSRWHLRRAVME